MATATKYQQVADDVLRGVGGVENVKSVTHCATRLRFVLHDRAKADKVGVEATRGVITVVEAGGQFQVVIGNTVGNVYEALTAHAGVAAGEGGSGGGFLATAIDLITSIFTPFLWVLAGSGLLKAFLAVWVKVSPDAAAGSTYAVLFAAGDAIFQFLPVLLAITSAKRFKANQFVSVAIASALIYSATIAVIPDAKGVSMTLQAFAAGGGKLSFLGIPIVMVSYLSAVIPTILAVFAQAHLERVLNKVIPEAVRNFVTPLVVLAVIVPATFLVIGPVSDIVGRGLSGGVNWIWALSPLVAGAIMGAFWQVFVIFGVHWGFVPVIVQDLSNHGYSLLTGPLFAAVLAQSGAGLAVFLKTKNKDLKEVAGPATVSAFLAGITEPIIYGVTLRLKKPFIYSCIGGAIGGGIAAAGGSAAAGFVLPGAITLTATMGIGNFTLQLIGVALAIVISFALTMVLGFDDVPNPVTAEDAAAGVVPTEAAGVTAPVAGKVVPLSAVPDKVFSSGAMGNGLAVQPSEGKAYAPISGTLVTLMPHAFGIKGANGVEVLVHIGLDTVNLAGRGFTTHTTQGATVTAGDLITEFDLAAIAAAGYNPMTIMTVTNTHAYAAVVPVADGDVLPTDLALDVVV